MFTDHAFPRAVHQIGKGNIVEAAEPLAETNDEMISFQPFRRVVLVDYPGVTQSARERFTAMGKNLRGAVASTQDLDSNAAVQLI